MPEGTIPLIPSVGVKLKLEPLQVIVVISEITAIGLMVTVTENTVPVQLPVTGVTR